MTPQAVRSDEFDAFGPWVLPITTLDEVPPLYRGHRLDLGSALKAVKVPRDITRRDANPTMDLYDHLVVLHEDRLTVLSRGGDGYTTRQVRPEQVLAVEDSTDLLDGRLVLHLSGAGPGRVVLRYNGSSREVIGDLLRALRRVYLPDRPVVAPPAGPRSLALDELGPDDVALVTLQHETLPDEPTMALLAAHPRRRLAPTTPGVPGALSRLVHSVRPMTLQGLVVCGDGVEVQLLHRRTWWVRGARPVHSIARTIVPLARLSEVTVSEHPVYGAARDVRLRLAEAHLTVPVPAGSPAERVLTGLVE